MTPQHAADALARVRETHPLVHNITNYVVMNSTANALLALGAAPVMAHAVDEVEEMVGIAGALVINIGTLSPPWIEAMLLAGAAAGRRGIPVVLDPVGAGATRLRTDTARRILDEVEVTLVRGNASEVAALAGDAGATRGVDSTQGVDEAADGAARLARALGVTVAITGPVDLVTDGEAVIRVANGHPLMAAVTGTGCAATAIAGAFLAADGGTQGATGAAAAALACYGLAGERAAEGVAGPGSYWPAVLDALYALQPDDVVAGARIRGG